MTSAQRTISAQKTIQSKTKDRRESTELKRLAYKLVPEEQVRLAKKITKRFRITVLVNEADRRHQAPEAPVLWEDEQRRAQQKVSGRSCMDD